MLPESSQEILLSVIYQSHKFLSVGQHLLTALGKFFGPFLMTILLMIYGLSPYPLILTSTLVCDYV